MNNAYTGFSTKNTEVTSPIPGEKQVLNSTGGYVYELDVFKVLERFLILGSEGGSYYIGEKKLTKDNALNTIKAIEADGRRAVDLIVAVSDQGRAAKNDPAIFALALACAAKSPETRSYALANLPKVCRIPTHLFHFLTYVKQFRGFGRGLKRAVGNWYNDLPVERLAYEMVKYQGRDDWTNADALRLSHPNAAWGTDPDVRNLIYKWVVDGFEPACVLEEKITGLEHGGILPKIFVGFECAKEQSHIKDLVGYIKEYNLSREMLPTEHLTKPEVWEALLEKMPLTAMIRNLGNMSKVGLLKPMSAASKLVVEKLADQAALKKARIHPISVLIAMKQYQSGHGLKGSGTWVPVPKVVDALDDAFYLAFNFMEPTGKRFLFGVDVSGSMGWSTIAGVNLTPAEGAAAMALACAKSEREYHIMGFADSFRDLGITPKMRLTDALKQTTHQNFGSTDCALPMKWALKEGVNVDVFVVITDNEVNQGSKHPKQALEQYRNKTGIRAKQVIMGMTAIHFTIGDPNDPYVLDVAGFDTNVPTAIQEFSRI